ncbi:hypothetical protein N5853_08595 [Bartonella sp. HY329]|uniref:hypothetical protein n=1 Tax=unclassified Bartonella TaxID=2645622 RepID=UPI0021C7C5F1|nr:MULTISPECIES: hypothetical protein [unclassified Bartonella]UXM94173.1 hypothetical protein N5853_08595 [Bartonella sp. HY329]UXN08495.1 hypothetical protein N5852_08605 [Bartonella sp. HY328]
MEPTKIQKASTLIIAYISLGPLIGVLPYIFFIAITMIIDDGVSATLLNLEFHKTILGIAFGMTFLAYILGLPAAIINGLYYWWYVEHNRPLSFVRKTLFCIITSFIIVFVMVRFIHTKQVTMFTSLYVSLISAIFYSMSSLLAIYCCDKLSSYRLKKRIR